MSIKIASWNVNSAKSRLNHLTSYLKSDNSPEILLLQEIKCTTDKFPYLEIEDLGYNVVAHGQKTYNGVAILSKYPIEDVITDLPGDDSDEQARYIEALISIDSKALRVASVYVPNGNTVGSDKFNYKLNFLDRLYNHTKTLLSYDEILAIGGDYNIAPKSIDVYDPDKLDGSICYHIEERKKFRALEGLGLTDSYRFFHPDKSQYTWWDYRAGAWQKNKGYRIDHFLISPEALDLCISSDVDLKPRDKEKPSDHTPVWLKLNV